MAKKSNNEVKIKFEAETSEFTEGIQKMNSDMSKLRSELKLNAAQLKGNANDTNLLQEQQKLLSTELEKSREKVELTSQKLEKAKEIYGENSKEVRSLEIALNSAKTQEQNIQNEIQKCTEQIKKNADEVKESESTYGKLSSTIEEQKSEFNALKKEYINVALEQGKNSDEAKTLAERMNRLSQEIQENARKVSSAEAETEKYEQAIRNAGEEAENASNGGFTVFKGILSDLGSDLIGKCIDGIKDFAVSVVETGMEFEAGMSQVAAISGATGDELDALKEKASEMGMTTKYTSAEAAEAMNYMAMAGWKTEDMLEGVEGIMNLAAASGEELGTTSDIVTDALTAFGMSANESSHFADVMAAASANANTNVSMMGESFKYVAPVAGSLGYTIEDTSLAIGLMANSGIKASQGGTALRKLLTNLSKPTDSVADAMDKLGISLENNDGSMKSLKELMQDLRGSFGQCKMPLEEFQQKLNQLEDSYANGEVTEKKFNKAVGELIEQAYGAEGALKAKYAATLAGQTGMSGLLAIVNASEKDFNKLESAIYGATDAENGYSAASEMAKIQQDNLKGDIELMESAIDGLKEGIADDLNGTLRETVQGITNDVVPAMQGMYGKIKEGTTWLSEHEAAVATVAIVLGSMTAGIKAYNIVTKIKAAMEAAETTSLIGLAAAQTGLNTAMFASPITWVVAAIVGLVAGFILLWNKCDGFRNFWIGLWNGIKSVASSLGNGIKEAIQGIGETFSAVKEVASKYLGALKGIASNKLKEVKNTFTSHGGGIKGAAAVYMGLIKDRFTIGFKVLNKLTGGKLEEVKNTAVEKFTGLKDKAGESLGKLKGIASKSLTNMKNTFTSHGGGIKGAAAVVMEGVRAKFTAEYNLINKLTGGKLDELKNKAVEKLTGIKESFSGAIEKIKGFFDFDFHWPHIPTPKITVTWDTNGALAKAGQLLGYPGMPNFGIQWNAEGAILTKPMIFGFANGMFQGGGEAGPEAVLPIAKLEEYIGNQMEKYIQPAQEIDYERLGKEVAKANAKIKFTATVNTRDAERFIKKVR